MRRFLLSVVVTAGVMAGSPGGAAAARDHSNIDLIVPASSQNPDGTFPPGTPVLFCLNRDGKHDWFLLNKKGSGYAAFSSKVTLSDARDTAVSRGNIYRVQKGATVGSPIANLTMTATINGGDKISIATVKQGKTILQSARGIAIWGEPDRSACLIRNSGKSEAADVSKDTETTWSELSKSR